MCLVAGEAAYCLRQGLYTGLVLQICRAYPDSWPDVCTLDLCYRSVELTQTPWPDVHNCCKSRPVWTSSTSTVAAPSTLSSKKYVVGYKLRSFLSQFVGAACWSNLVKIKSKMNMMTILHISFYAVVSFYGVLCARTVLTLGNIWRCNFARRSTHFVWAIQQNVKLCGSNKMGVWSARDNWAPVHNSV